MPTVMDGLTQLGSDLRDAVASVLGLRTDMQALKASTIAGSQTVINNFINRPSSVTFHIDANNGVDDTDHGTFAAPFRTLDYAVQQADTTRPVGLVCFTDVTLTRVPGFQNSLNIIGASKAPGINGLSFSYVSRKLSFAPESSQSPVPGSGRIPGKLNVTDLRTFYIDLALPELPVGIDVPWVIESNGGSININKSTITVATAASLVRLLASNGGQRMTVTMTDVTLGANVAGKLFVGIAAGVNPNSIFTYETNITSG